MPVGKDVVIIGGAIQGCQLGEFLTKRGRQRDHRRDRGGGWGPDWCRERKTRLFYWFDKKGVELLTGVTLVEITDRRPLDRHPGRRPAVPCGRQR